MLLLVGVLTALAVTPTGMKGMRQAENRSLTMAYARHLLESTLSLPFNQQASVSSTKLETIISNIPANTYTYSITVQNVAQNTEIHSIEVTIQWSEDSHFGQASTKYIRLVAYSAKLE